MLFAIIGLFYAMPDHLLPVFNQGYSGVLMGTALIFVAYEGFELIPNAVAAMILNPHTPKAGFAASARA